MKKIGDKGEIIAIRYLQKHGYSIRETNFKFGRFGEIDIIVEKGSMIYFIEVKFRNNLKFGFPEDSISKYKLHKCLKTIHYYCCKYAIDDEKIQFDVISIIRKTDSYQISHYKAVEV